MNGDDFVMNVPIIPDEDVNTWGLIDAIIKKYGALEAPQLSELTHRQGSAWALKSADGSVIQAEEILADGTIFTA